MQRNPLQKILLITGFLAEALSQNAYAGAWTQPKGSTQAIATLSVYTASRRFDTAGNSTAQPRYDKLTLNPYVEYGWTDATTLGADINLERAESSGRSNTNLSDSTLFLRQRVWHNDRLVFSVQPSLTLPPLFNRDRRPALGSSSATLGMRGLAGYSFSWLGREHYVGADLGYMHRFGAPHDQLVGGLEAGLRFANRWTFMPQLFQRLSLPMPNSDARFTFSPRDDYNQTRLQLSFLYRFDAANAVQFGGYQDVAGRNSGIGTGALLAWWGNF